MRVLDWQRPRQTAQATEHCWRYGLLAEDVEVDGFCCESYGVVVTDELTGQSAQCRHITVNDQEALELLKALARNAVPPTALMDVVEDWLGH